MSNPAAKHPLSRVHLVLAITCGLTGVVLFQFFGNATRGYVNTSSTFWWWISQWLNPAAETQHGWLILGLSGWVWWRNGRSRKAEDNPPFKLRRPHSIAPAIVALVAALALHALGFAAQQTRVSIIALLIFSWGVVRLAGGRRAGELAMFPLAFLMFAIPFSALDEVGLPFGDLSYYKLSYVNQAFWPVYGDFVLMLHEWRIDPGAKRPNPNEMTDFNMLTMNAKAFPGTAPLVVRTGQRVRVRLGRTLRAREETHRSRSVQEPP